MAPQKWGWIESWDFPIHISCLEFYRKKEFLPTDARWWQSTLTYWKEELEWDKMDKYILSPFLSECFLLFRHKASNVSLSAVLNRSSQSKHVKVKKEHLTLYVWFKENRWHGTSIMSSCSQGSYISRRVMWMRKCHTCHQRVRYLFFWGLNYPFKQQFYFGPIAAGETGVSGEKLQLPKALRGGEQSGANCNEKLGGGSGVTAETKDPNGVLHSRRRGVSSSVLHADTASGSVLLLAADQ